MGEGATDAYYEHDEETLSAWLWGQGCLFIVINIFGNHHFDDQLVMSQFEF